MSYTERMKEVYFSEYCKTCVHKKLKEHESPCDECLAEGARPESHKPVKYVKSSRK